ncbi:hypothetical protein T492DRAFT_1020338 [Pavlovales sp. CCMP2436]|nr:hypothetical protein T492DRAFT_1020338 [Pavlovales sp. CCMP2436]
MLGLVIECILYSPPTSAMGGATSSSPPSPPPGGLTVQINVVGIVINSLIVAVLMIPAQIIFSAIFSFGYSRTSPIVERFAARLLGGDQVEDDSQLALHAKPSDMEKQPVIRRVVSSRTSAVGDRRLPRMDAASAMQGATGSATSVSATLAAASPPQQKLAAPHSLQPRSFTTGTVVPTGTHTRLYAPDSSYRSRKRAAAVSVHSPTSNTSSRRPSYGGTGIESNKSSRPYRRSYGSAIEPSNVPSGPQGEPPQPPPAGPPDPTPPSLPGDAKVADRGPPPSYLPADTNPVASLRYTRVSRASETRGHGQRRYRFSSESCAGASLGLGASGSPAPSKSPPRSLRSTASLGSGHLPPHPSAAGSDPMASLRYTRVAMPTGKTHFSVDTRAICLASTLPRAGASDSPAPLPPKSPRRMESGHQPPLLSAGAELPPLRHARVSMSASLCLNSTLPSSEFRSDASESPPPSKPPSPRASPGSGRRPPRLSLTDTDPEASLRYARVSRASDEICASGQRRTHVSSDIRRRASLGLASSESSASQQLSPRTSADSGSATGRRARLGSKWGETLTPIKGARLLLKPLAKSSAARQATELQLRERMSLESVAHGLNEATVQVSPVLSLCLRAYCADQDLAPPVVP